MTDTPETPEQPKAPELPKPGPRYYRPDKHERNVDGEPVSVHVGVPLRDLTEEEFAAFPLWLQYEVDASPLYQRSKPRLEQDEPATGDTIKLDAPPEPEAPAVPRRQKKTQE